MRHYNATVARVIACAPRGIGAPVRFVLPERLPDGFEGKLTSSKWAAIARCSPDTALRDISDLLARGVLRKSDAGGRSTGYELNDPPE